MWDVFSDPRVKKNKVHDQFDGYIRIKNPRGINNQDSLRLDLAFFNAMEFISFVLRDGISAAVYVLRSIATLGKIANNSRN